MPIYIDGEPTDEWQTVFGGCHLVDRKDVPKYIPEEFRNEDDGFDFYYYEGVLDTIKDIERVLGATKI